MLGHKFFRLTLWVQAIYTLATALWPLVDIQSFMDVSGKKTDIWLVKTVAVLLIPISMVFFSALVTKVPDVLLLIVALFSSAGLMFIDFYYASNGTIKWVYAIDGCIQSIFISVWIYAVFRVIRRKS